MATTPANRAKIREKLYNSWREELQKLLKGTWIPHYDFKGEEPIGYLCSTCKMWSEEKTHFCPHCGASMDERGMTRFHRELEKTINAIIEADEIITE